MTESEEMHQWYCEQTGQHARRAWNCFAMSGWPELLKEYSKEDIYTVLRYLQAEIREKRRNVGALRLKNFLQPDEFADNLWLAQKKKNQRPPQPPPGVEPRTFGNTTVLVEAHPEQPPADDACRAQFAEGLKDLRSRMGRATR